MTKLYNIRATYHAEVDLVVSVPSDLDPHKVADPANWLEIESEHEVDYILHDTDANSIKEYE